MARAHVIFFDNGNTCVLRDGEQVAHLQRPFVQLYAEFLQSQQEDPAEFRFTLHTRKGRWFLTEGGLWNWRFE